MSFICILLTIFGTIAYSEARTGEIYTRVFVFRPTPWVRTQGLRISTKVGPERNSRDCRKTALGLASALSLRSVLLPMLSQSPNGGQVSCERGVQTSSIYPIQPRCP